MADAAWEPLRRVRRTAAGNGLLWRAWEDDLYIVYQPSSAETHVFNETTASLLRCLDESPVTLRQLKARAEDALGAQRGALAEADLAFAVRRLDELGLIGCMNEMDDVQ